ncbi:MAG: hypothetical protein ABSH11_05715 [Verrucomicrobiota bacterium]|jgi:hypothetical protein
MATKENKRQVKELVEGLEQRVQCGPAIRDAEIQSARDFLRQHDFSPASDYFNRLAHVENRLQGRAREISQPRTKCNYGGKAGGYQMQVQSIFDHVILSTCYAGDFNYKHGRVKISHRFNQEGRVDFVELKFLNALHPPLNGELRKLLAVKDYSSLRKDWYAAEASVLRILPQELIFLYEDIFRCPKSQLFAWLLNIGHGIVEDLLQDLQSQKNKCSLPPDSVPGPVCPDFSRPANDGPTLGWSPEAWNQNGNGRTVCLERSRTGCEVVDRNGNGFEERLSQPVGYPGQLPLDALLQDEVALPILEKAARLESVVEIENSTEILVRYLRKIQCANLTQAGSA